MSARALHEEQEISSTEIARRRTFLNLGPDDEVHLAAIHAVIEDNLDNLIEELYRHLARFDELRPFLGDAESLARLKSSQRRYLLSLGRGADRVGYAESRLCIGRAHEAVGLAQKCGEED
ncbi:protoglobin domain-containing protein [Candidatus Nitrospira bockiana]